MSSRAHWRGARRRHGSNPAGPQGLSALLNRLGRLQNSGKTQRIFTVGTVWRVRQFLREARDYVSAAGQPMFGLPGDFALSRQDTRSLRGHGPPETRRELPPVVLAQLLDEPALALLEKLLGPTMRAAIELLAATGPQTG